MLIRPVAIKAPTLSPAFRPILPSRNSVRVAMRLNRGTRPMPVAEMSIAMVPQRRSIWYSPLPDEEASGDDGGLRNVISHYNPPF